MQTVNRHTFKGFPRLTEYTAASQHCGKRVITHNVISLIFELKTMKTDQISVSRQQQCSFSWKVIRGKACKQDPTFSCQHYSTRKSNTKQQLKSTLPDIIVFFFSSVETN